MSNLLYLGLALVAALIPTLVLFGRLKAIETAVVEANELAAERAKTLRAQSDLLSQIEIALKVANERK